MFNLNKDAGARLSTFFTSFPTHLPIKEWPRYTRWYFGIWPIVERKDG